MSPSPTPAPGLIHPKAATPSPATPTAPRLILIARALLLLLFTPSLLHADPALHLQDKSFFTDRVATATACFSDPIPAVDGWSQSSPDCNLIEVYVEPLENDPRGKTLAVLRFLPTKTGPLTLPAFEFSSGETTYRTAPAQILVREPIRSKDMSLTITPAKTRVYAGEPVRLHLRWNCSLNASRLRSLQLYPDFFNNPDIEVVIPRSTDPEDLQVGLPIGGRRSIARRTLAENKNLLGTIELPLFLRFSTPGTHTLPAVRLECALMADAEDEFARYAAHFNNGLFEPVSPGKLYDRVFTRSEPIRFDVLPLPPETQNPNFSRLFKPVEITSAIEPTEAMIGELMELEIRVSGNAPHGMIDLPKLSKQPGLRERFIVDDNASLSWQPDGTVFRTRIRALTTSIKALPALHFPVFDPETGTLATISTNPIPLTLTPNDGRHFLTLRSFKNASVPLTDSPEGIWHNETSSPMNDLIHTVLHFANSLFWPLLAAGPVAFALLLPVARDRRRRALDPRYGRRAEAYRAFRKLPDGTPEKWQAFLRFLAVTFQAGERSWTVNDSRESLPKIGLENDDIEKITAMHQAADARDFSPSPPAARFQHLAPLAKRILRLAAKTLLLAILLIPTLRADTRDTARDLSPKPPAKASPQPKPSNGSEWSAAESLFAAAQSATPGSEKARALYMDAALKFEAAARETTRRGKSYYNAGNAWFQAGEIGRSIAAYRLARTYRPTDPRVRENLATARAMTTNDVPSRKSWWQSIPLYWVRPALIAASSAFWLSLLLHIRYRNRAWRATTAATALLFLAAATLFLSKSLLQSTEGVVIVDETRARKGPGHNYAPAFQEPVHDGLEFTLLETRNHWARIRLSDKRQCWLPLEQLQLIEN